MSVRESCVTSFKVLCGLTGAGVLNLTCIESVDLNVQTQKAKQNKTHHSEGEDWFVIVTALLKVYFSGKKEILSQTHKQHVGVFCLQNRCGFKGYTIYLEIKINEYAVDTTWFILSHASKIASLRWEINLDKNKLMGYVHILYLKTTLLEVDKMASFLRYFYMWRQRICAF